MLATTWSSSKRTRNQIPRLCHTFNPNSAIKFWCNQKSSLKWQFKSHKNVHRNSATFSHLLIKTFQILVLKVTELPFLHSKRCFWRLVTWMIRLHPVLSKPRWTRKPTTKAKSQKLLLTLKTTDTRSTPPSSTTCQPFCTLNSPTTKETSKLYSTMQFCQLCYWS